MRRERAPGSWHVVLWFGRNDSLEQLASVVSIVCDVRLPGRPRRHGFGTSRHLPMDAARVGNGVGMSSAGCWSWRGMGVERARLVLIVGSGCSGGDETAGPADMSGVTTGTAAEGGAGAAGRVGGAVNTT